MKLQHLAVIFVIIILPIVMILSGYINYQLDAIELRHTYDTKLIDATYDSIKAYQLNTVNNAISDIQSSKIEDLEAAVNAFFNSLSTTFNYTGYNSDVMKQYIPAIVFTMYDGYYIYSPFQNVLTGVPDHLLPGNDPYVDEKYQNNTTLYSLKPYVYYSCRYKKDPNIDVVITYTLDNYITIQGKVPGQGYVNESGYLIDGIYEEDGGNTYRYDGIPFTNAGEGKLEEYLGQEKHYSYAKYNGTKYYLDSSSSEIFYIDSKGERAVQTRNGLGDWTDYSNLINHNNSAYRYYRDAYNFTNRVESLLGTLTGEDAVDENGNKIYIELGNEDYFGQANIFAPVTGTAIQDSDSNFNQQRMAVIRYTIEKNLSASIAAYKDYSRANAEFIMPKITDADWSTLTNNISIATFLQGFTVGGKDYNTYCVVANNLTKEYVDENDIYLLGNDDTYYRANDTNVQLATGLSYQPGIWKMNFERRIYRKGENNDNYTEETYFPVQVIKNSVTHYPYIGSYSSVISSSVSVENSEPDMYKYMRKLNSSGSHIVNDNVRRAYYTALGRERWGAYHVSTGDLNE